MLGRVGGIAGILGLMVLSVTPVFSQNRKLGTVTFPTSGAPAARAWFLQGVSLLHSFEYEDAAEAFRKAQAIDSTFALAYWGEALTHDHPLWGEQDSVTGRAVLLRLGPTPEARASKAFTARERVYLAAVEALYGPGDKMARAQAYAAAMRTAHEAYPRDLEAAAFYALALLGTQPSRSTDLRLRVEAAAVAEDVFRQNSKHPGAAHYLIHAYDDPQLAPLGLRAANAYANIAPASEHAVHMPSHIFLQLGKWDEMVASNEKAFSASMASARRKGSPASHYDFHSLYWLHYGYLQQGRHREAKALEDSARSMLAGEQGELKMWARMGPGLMNVQYVAEGGQPSGIPPDKDRDRVIAWYSAGLAAAQSGDSGLLRAAEQHTKAYIDSVKVVSKPVRISDLVLQAQLAKLQGRPEESLTLLEQAAALEDSIRAVGPPYGLPSREVLAQVLLTRGKAQQAADQFDLVLQRTPNRSEALLGRARAAVSLGDSASADHYYTMLLRNWQKADSNLPGLMEAKRAVRHADDLRGIGR